MNNIMDSKAKSDSAHKQLQHLFSILTNSKHTSSCFKALTDIKSTFVPDPKKLLLFIHSGGLKHLLTQLQSDNKKVIDVALSILGHCVLEQEPRVMFRKEGGLAILAKVLRNFKDPRIQSRSCRAIGSLAHDKRNTEKFIMELGVHFELGYILDQAVDEETLCMAIRAIRNIADSKEHVAILGKNHILPKLSTLLIKSDNTNVQKTLLLTLLHVSGYMKRFSETSAHYWVGSEDGGKLVARLVELRQSKILIISSKAPQLLQQIVQDKNVRPFLSGKEAFETLLPLVKNEREAGKCGTTSYMTILLALCRENPHGFMKHGGIPLLLDLICDSNIELSKIKNQQTSVSSRLLSQHSSIFNTLLAFKYDTSSLMELAENGLVSILTKKIQAYIDSYREDHSRKNPKDANTQAHTVCDSRDNDNEEKDNTLPKPCCKSDCKIRCRLKRQYRTNSPSYQAVEMEFDQWSRLRESNFDCSTALNIFGWNPDQPNRNEADTCISEPSSPSSFVSLSPSHSLFTLSENSSEIDSPESIGDFSSEQTLGISSEDLSSSTLSELSSSPMNSPSASLLSPLHPPSFTSSDFDELDDYENQTICYSPVYNEPNIDSKIEEINSLRNVNYFSVVKRPRVSFVSHRVRKFCCETDLKMLWLKLGQIENKDFYENWPEFATETYHNEQDISVYLILKLSWLDDAPHQLITSDLMKILIDYLIETPKPSFRACQVLFRLASVPSFFVKLLESKFPSEIYLALNKRISNKPCCPLHSCIRRVYEQILEQMSISVGRFGRGEMESILLKNSEDSSLKEVIALVTPLVVRSKTLLRRFIEELNVLEVTFLMLRSQDLRVYAVGSLTSLGCFLKMEDMLCPVTSLNEMFQQTPCQVAELEEDIVFKLDADQAVGAVRPKLNGSSFFDAMFRGGFQESRVTAVTLTGIQASILKVILHCIYGCGSQCVAIRGIEGIVRSTTMAVSLLESLDRFLLLERLDSFTNLIANQEWCSFPVTFVALWKALDKRFPFCTKLRNHLMYLPFLSTINFDERFELISTLIVTDIADETLSAWKQMFLFNLEKK